MILSLRTVKNFCLYLHGLSLPSKISAYVPTLASDSGILLKFGIQTAADCSEVELEKIEGMKYHMLQPEFHL